MAFLFTPPNLERMFSAFCRYEAPKSDGKELSLNNCEKWMEQANLLSEKLTAVDLSIHFKKYRRRTLDYDTFSSYLYDLSEKKKINLRTMEFKLSTCGMPGVQKCISTKNFQSQNMSQSTFEKPKFPLDDSSSLVPGCSSTETKIADFMSSADDSKECLPKSMDPKPVQSDETCSEAKTMLIVLEENPSNLSLVTDLTLTQNEAKIIELKPSSDDSQQCSTTSSVDPQDPEGPQCTQSIEKCSKKPVKTQQLTLLDQSDAQSMMMITNAGSPFKNKNNNDEKWTKTCKVLDKSMEKLSIIEEAEDFIDDVEPVK